MVVEGKFHESFYSIIDSENEDSDKGVPDEDLGWDREITKSPEIGNNAAW